MAEYRGTAEAPIRPRAMVLIGCDFAADCSYALLAPQASLIAARSDAWRELHRHVREAHAGGNEGRRG